MTDLLRYTGLGLAIAQAIATRISVQVRLSDAPLPDNFDGLRATVAFSNHRYEGYSAS